MNFRYALFAVLALAVPTAHAMTGAEAAQYITSEPSDAYYVTPDTFELAWAYYDGGELKSTSFSIGVDSWQSDVEAAVSSLKNTVNSVALDACMALAKIEALRAVDAYLSARVDALTDSSQYAMSQLDEVRQTDSDQDTTIQEVSERATPPDGVSISKIGDDVGVLALHGFADAVGADWYLPHPSGGVLGWHSVIDLFDSVTIGGSEYSQGAFGIQFGLKGWGSPTEPPGACVRTLSGLLHGDDPDGPHYVLTKCGGALHYTPLGQPLNDGAVVDNLSLTTNQATGASMQGVASLYGWDLVGTKAGFIPAKGGGSPATLKWLDPEDMVDDSSLAQTTAKSGAKVWEVKGAHTYAGNHGRHYFGTGDDSELGWHELPNVTTNNVVGDEVTISSAVGETDDQKILGLKGWPAGDGLLALAYADGALAYLPFPAIGTNLVTHLDGVSLSSNSLDKAQIKGWDSEAGCAETAAELLKVADSGSQGSQSGHEIVTRVGGVGGVIHYLPFGTFEHPSTSQFTVDDDTKVFTIKGEDGKFLRGTAEGGVEWAAVAPGGGPVADGESIVTNSAGMLRIFGYGVTSNRGKFLKYGEQGGLVWTDALAADVDDMSLKTNSVGKIEIAGFGNAGAAGTSPVSTGSGIEWKSPASAIRLIGSDGSFSVVGNGGVTNSIAFTPDVNSNVTVTVTGDGNGNATVTIGVRWR